jgi:hypothetical protein
MKIIWFSEIKWSYLKTRKQHILTNFNNSDEILFIEPISLNLKNNFSFSTEKNIKYITIPQIQNSDYKLISYIIQLPYIKYFLAKYCSNKIYSLFKNLKFKPDIIIISNIFWIPFVKILKEKYNIKVIYDCNDNPLAFPNAYKKNFLFNSTLRNSDFIIVPYKSYNNFIPNIFHNKIKIISNGVDTNLLKIKTKKIDKIKNIKKIVMYVGSIDTRIDYKLIDFLASQMKSFNFIFIGNIKKQNNTIFNKLNSNHNNIYHFNSINYNEISSYISYSSICIIPFIKNELSKNILPNKLFEYSLLEKPFIMTNFNNQLKDLDSRLLIAKNKNDFKNLILQQEKKSYCTKDLKSFALNYSWKNISKEYRKFIIENKN